MRPHSQCSWAVDVLCDDRGNPRDPAEDVYFEGNGDPLVAPIPTILDVLQERFPFNSIPDPQLPMAGNVPRAGRSNIRRVVLKILPTGIHRYNVPSIKSFHGGI